MPEFQILGQAVSAVEALAAGTGLLSVVLVLRMNVLTWPVGIVSVACYAQVFHGARLYADAVLQLFFAGASVYGWLQWHRSGPTHDGARPVLRGSTMERWGSLAAGLAATGIVALALGRWTDSPAPVADAAVFSFSLLATLLQARRRVEGWWYWILVDLISLPLYWSRSLHLTAMLYGVFLLLAVTGLRAWQARLDRTPS